MSTLRALVRRTTGRTRHTAVVGTEYRALPDAASVRIAPDGHGAFLLLRFTPEGVGITDTWHLSVEEAKHQALFEYGITNEDWIEETN